jgi:secondary thiamine-phosphate synthase enzyme
MFQKTIAFPASRRGLSDITAAVEEMVRAAAVGQGICHLFLHHTSASLIIQENADPDVKRDLDAFFLRLVPDGDPIFRHTAEGPDDMPAHIRSVLTANCLSIPVISGELGLGTWQGVYLWEHRLRGSSRRLTVTVCP